MNRGWNHQYSKAHPRWWRRPLMLALWVAAMLPAGGCTTIRVTDPPATADMEFLMTGAAEEAIRQLSIDALRDRTVFVDTSWLIPTSKPNAPDPTLPETFERQPSLEHLFLIGELRAKLLKSGVRLVADKDKAQVVLEVRSGALSVNRLDFLLGISAAVLPTSAIAGTNISTPEISILKMTRQHGWASVAVVAYWRDSGELLAISGPFIGHTRRQDVWILGTGPNTRGNIPPAAADQ
jgi:hypothetical protein